MRSFEMKLVGHRELQRMLDELPGASFRRVLRPAMNASARPMTKAVRDQAPKKTRSLTKSIGVKNVTYEKSKTVVVIIGPRRGAKFGYIQKVGKSNRTKDRLHVPANYAHLVHQGTKPHFLKKTDTGNRELTIVKPKGKRRYFRERKVYLMHGDRHPGAKANPFMKRAWNATQRQSMSILRDEFGKRIPIEAKKLAKKRS